MQTVRQSQAEVKMQQTWLTFKGVIDFLCFVRQQRPIGRRISHLHQNAPCRLEIQNAM